LGSARRLAIGIEVRGKDVATPPIARRRIHAPVSREHAETPAAAR
jgi:hypothetical protein